VTVLEGLGAEAFGFAGDLAASGVPEAAVAATVERFGQLDALVANKTSALWALLKAEDAAAPKPARKRRNTRL
jgi:hypothetical protein